MRGDSKINRAHRSKMAYIYVRQSSPGQVIRHPESARMQRDLAKRAAELGWPEERIVVLDSDLGKTGRCSVGREDFKRIVGEVSAGEVGIVVGISVTRLARNAADWFPLVEMCGLTKTLIADDDGVYDPNDPNDRLILGVKGTLSEAELVAIRARLEGAKWSMAHRGELRRRLPTGYIWDRHQGVVLDPDERVQTAVRRFFRKFAEIGSGTGLARSYNVEGVLFPCRGSRGAWDGPVHWRPLSIRRATTMLHNPVYAGAYMYGQYRDETILDSETRTKRTVSKRVPMEDWKVLIRDSHPAYISWEVFLKNQEKLKENWNMNGGPGPPRSGATLLQGIVYCSACDRSMAVNYSGRTARAAYWCNVTKPTGELNYCQSVVAARVDRCVEEQVLSAINPLGIEAAFGAVEELERRSADLRKAWEQRIQRAEYEAGLAQRRYEAVDPANRLVAGNLEKDWEEKLREIEEIKKEYSERASRPPIRISDEERDELRELAQDLPRLWRSKKTKQQDRKKIVRILIREVWILPTRASKDKDRRVRIHWQSGAVTEGTLYPPKWGMKHKATSDEVIAAIRELQSSSMGPAAIAEELNRRGLHPCTAERFTGRNVDSLMRSRKVGRQAAKGAAPARKGE